LISTLFAAAEKHFAKHPVFLLQVSSGNIQNKKNLPSYVLLIRGPAKTSDIGVHCYLDFKVKANSYEGLRFRCVDPQCKHRPTGGEAEGESSIPEEDAEDLEVSAYMCFDEVDAEDADMEVDAALQCEEGDDKNKNEEPPKAPTRLRDVDMFTFAFPIEWYRKIMQQCSKFAQHLVAITRTAHPCLQLAGRALNMDVIALTMGPKAHSLAHGQDLLEEIILKQKLAQAKSPVKITGTKRIRASSLQFITVSAPPVAEQLLRACECTPIPSSTWRIGMNSQVDGLEEKMPLLLQKELDDNGLGLMAGDGDRFLVTMKPLRDGDVICMGSALWYDSVSVLEEMLSLGGNACLKDMLVRVDGIALSAASDNTSSIYGVLVGACRYAANPVGRRKAGPNACFVLDTEAGIGDGLLKLVVKTRNHAGIAAKNPIYMNYGSEYVSGGDEELDSVAAKKFKGCLDTWLKTREESEIKQIVQVGGQLEPDLQELPPGETKTVEPNPDVPPGPNPAGGADGGTGEEAAGAGGAGTAAGAGGGEGATGSGATGSEGGNKPPGVGRSEGPNKHPGAGVGPGPEPLPGPVDPKNQQKPLSELPWRNQGDVLATAESGPWGAFVFKKQAEGKNECRVYAHPQHSVTKKVPPNTVLLVLREGKAVQNRKGLPYNFTSLKNQVFVLQNSKTKSVNGPKTLAQCVDEFKLTSIQQHGSVAPVLPKTLKVQGSELFFVPDAQNMVEALEHCIGCSSLATLWVMKNSDGILQPWGVAVATKKQFSIAVGSSVVMQ
jgi:hypothetical protein